VGYHAQNRSQVLRRPPHSGPTCMGDCLCHSHCDLRGRHLQLLAEQVGDLLKSRWRLFMARLSSRAVTGLMLLAAALLVEGCGGGTTASEPDAASASAPQMTTSSGLYSDSSSPSGASIYGSIYTQEEQDAGAYQEGAYWQAFSDAYE
jgi:hypothetical protein